MEKFNLEKYLENPSRKVVTRDGREAIIVCTNADDKFPVVAKIQGWDAPFVELFNRDGIHSIDWDGCIFDLFFADEGEKLTEFEKTMIQFSHERNSLIQFEHTKDEINAHLYLYSKKLRYLARKELNLVDNTCREYALNGAYKQGKQDALKDLPKWKKVDSNPAKVQYNLQGKRLYKNGEYYIELSDLETLQKEE